LSKVGHKNTKIIKLPI